MIMETKTVIEKLDKLILCLDKHEQEGPIGFFTQIRETLKTSKNIHEIQEALSKLYGVAPIAQYGDFTNDQERVLLELIHECLVLRNKTNQLRKKYPQLARLFGAHFHPEWREAHKSEQGAIIEFIGESQINELLDTLLEIQELKKQFSDDEKLREVIEDDLGLGNGLGIYLIGMTAVQWLDFVASIIKRELNNRKNKT